MPKYNHKACEDDIDATRMAENILRRLGYIDVQPGNNCLAVETEISAEALRSIARNAERISRWARGEIRLRKPLPPLPTK